MTLDPPVSWILLVLYNPFNILLKFNVYVYCNPSASIELDMEQNLVNIIIFLGFISILELSWDEITPTFSRVEFLYPSVFPAYIPWYTFILIYSSSILSSIPWYTFIFHTIIHTLIYIHPNLFIFNILIHTLIYIHPNLFKHSSSILSSNPWYKFDDLTSFYSTLIHIHSSLFNHLYLAFIQSFNYSFSFNLYSLLPPPLFLMQLTHTLWESVL